MSTSEKRILKNKKNRRKELKKHVSFVLFTLVFIGISATTFGSFLSKAKGSSDLPKYKYYTSYVVKEGDTLSDIAEKFHDSDVQNTASYLREVIHLNHLLDDSLSAGEYLVIPYFSTTLQ